MDTWGRLAPRGRKDHTVMEAKGHVGVIPSIRVIDKWVT